MSDPTPPPATETAETPISAPTPPSQRSDGERSSVPDCACPPTVVPDRTPCWYPSARVVGADDTPATPPLYWTTYVATLPTAAADADHSTVIGTCIWLASTLPGESYCWIDADASPPRVVCTVPQHRSHTNHESLAWLLNDALRRLYVVESETNLEAPRLRVYSFRPEDPDLFDRHHSPTAELRLCDKFDALVDRRSIPTYLADEYGLRVPIYLDSTSGPIEPLESVPAPVSRGPHQVCARPDPDVIYACTGDVVDGDSERYEFDVGSDQPTTTSVATDGGPTQ